MSIYNKNNYLNNFLLIRNKLNINIKQNIRKYNELKTYLSEFPRIHPQKECENFWSKCWQKYDLFSSKPITTCSERFSLLLPPPNITGSLHLGLNLLKQLKQ